MKVWHNLKVVYQQSGLVGKNKVYLLHFVFLSILLNPKMKGMNI